MISVIIASITEDFWALDVVVNSILRPNCPHECEVIIVSPHKIRKKSKHKGVVYIEEKNSTGSCEAYNYGLTFARGEYVAINTDDMMFGNYWWRFTDTIDVYGFISFKSGFLNVAVPHIFGFNRDFLENYMSGVIFNPALTHMYIDNDLGFRLAKIGFKVLPFNIVDGNVTHKNEKLKDSSKERSYRLDGMIFNYIWKKRHPNLHKLATLFPSSPYSENELYDKMCDLLLKDVSGEKYELPPPKYGGLPRIFL